MGQLWVLLKKNWTLRRRNFLAFAFELIFPIIMGAIMVVGKGNIIITTAKGFEDGIPIRIVPTTMKIFYYPNSKATKELMEIFKQRDEERRNRFGPTGQSDLAGLYMNIEAVNNTSDLGTNITQFEFGITTLIELQNADGDELPKKLTYRLRPDRFGILNPEKVYKYPWEQLVNRNGSIGDFESYKHLTYLQLLMGESVSRYWNGQNNAFKTKEVMLTIQMFYNPPDLRSSSFTKLLANMLSIGFIWSFAMTVCLNVKTLVLEKEIKLKEIMKIMGMSGFTHGLSWFLTFVTIMVPIMILYLVQLTVPLYGDTPVLTVDWSLLTAFMFLFTMALISYIFMISSLFSKANYAAVLSFIVYTSADTVGGVLYYWELSKSGKLGVALIFQTALFQAFMEIVYSEAVGEPLNWTNFDTPVHPSGVSLAEMMGMLVLDTGLHVTLYWYISNVAPWGVGVRRPFYFPFTTTYWLGTAELVLFGGDEPEPAHIPDKYFEAEPRNMKLGVEIKDLKKKFGRFYAVSGMSLNMYEGQITVLLGHNGAGKTTTMNMITGILSPTKGNALINGIDITKQTTEARKSMGVCPQHNVLYPTLTVQEHLRLFAELKGVPKEYLTEAVDRTANDIELQFKLSTYSKNLSGGQKRKLSVGMALIGGSKVVILDEPSAGMDPTARRSMWGTLLKAKGEGRTLLLSTHYMDEADTLGDRIAIMANGRTICCGSSVFLKKLYGTGYKLVIETTDGCDVPTLTNAVMSQMPNAKFVNVVNKEVIYNLPNEEKTSFHLLFRYLESNKDIFGIMSYGVTETTIEEVFLNAGDDLIEEKKDKTGQGPINSTQDATQDGHILDFNAGFDNLTGCGLVWSRMYGTFVKKTIDAWRNILMTLIQISVPFLLIYSAIHLIEKVSGDMEGTAKDAQPVFVNNLDGFRELLIPFSQNNSAKDVAEKLMEKYEDNVLRNGYKSELTDNMDVWSREKAEEIGPLQYRTKVIIGMGIHKQTVSTELPVVAHFSLNGVQSIFISVNYVLNTVLQWGVPDSEKEDYSLQSEIQRYEFKFKGKIEADREQLDQVIGLFSGIFLQIFGVIAGTFLVTLTIRFLILERKSGAKHVQILSGIDALTYWLPTFIFDAFILMTVSVGMVIMIKEQDVPGFRDGRIYLLLLAFILFNWAAIPSYYLFQFMFTSPTTGMVIGLGHPIFTGALPGVVFVLLNIVLKEETKDSFLFQITQHAFALIFPQFNFGMIFSLMQFNYFAHATYQCEDDECTNFYDSDKSVEGTGCEDEKDNMFCPRTYSSFTMPGVGFYLVMMMLQGIIYSTLVLMLDSNMTAFLQAPSEDTNYTPRDEEDSDVAAERVKVKEILSDPRQEALLISNLTKSYGFNTVVDHISVAISERDCFGLLGQNGAGKSTTFKMLTGETKVSRGNAWLNGKDIVNHINEVQSNMGYCPQFDALVDCMTARETLRLYARLRGVPSAKIENVVKSLIDVLLLGEYADIKCGGYSGGNKRKLSTAMSLVGNPDFILLDEPSAGMDPKARRQMWTILSKVRASGKTLILTSHSMEECDALCTKIVIMVNGRFVCLGSPQHLKNKFAQGYTIICNLQRDADGAPVPNEPVVNFVVDTFRGAKIFDVYQGFVHFQVPDKGVYVADLFEKMERNKARLLIDDYTVQQTTLEQVFLMFTKGQLIKSYQGGGCCSCCCGGKHEPSTPIQEKIYMMEFKSQAPSKTTISHVTSQSQIGTSQGPTSVASQVQQSNVSYGTEPPSVVSGK